MTALEVFLIILLALGSVLCLFLYSWWHGAEQRAALLEQMLDAEEEAHEFAQRRLSQVRTELYKERSKTG